MSEPGWISARPGPETLLLLLKLEGCVVSKNTHPPAPPQAPPSLAGIVQSARNVEEAVEKTARFFVDRQEQLRAEFNARLTAWARGDLQAANRGRRDRVAPEKPKRDRAGLLTPEQWRAIIRMLRSLNLLYPRAPRAPVYAAVHNFIEKKGWRPVRNRTIRTHISRVKF